MHPSNINGLNEVMHDLIADGNSVILVDHDTQILSEADWIVEIGPVQAVEGRYVIAENDTADYANNASSDRPVSQDIANARNSQPVECKRTLCAGDKYISLQMRSMQ